MGMEQVAALFHDLTGLGHLPLGQAVEVFLRGAHLHLHEDTHVIEQRGDDGRADDDAVLDAKRFSHDEGGGAMMGGSSWPPTEAVASTEPANSLE